MSVDFDKFSDTKKQQPKIVLILIIYTMYILKFIRWDWLLCSYDILSCKEMTPFLTDAIFCVTQIKMHNFLSWLTEDLHNFLTTRWAIFLMILCLWMRYTIFIYQNRQFSWWFYVSEQDTQFSYIKTGNFPDDFISQPRYTIFIHQNRQFSWQFYVSDPDVILWLTGLKAPTN